MKFEGSFDLDSDSDGVGDSVDNCIDIANPSQQDSDGDRFGNVCDADLNNDCIVNFIDLGTMKRFFLLPPGPSADPAFCN